MLSGMVHDRKQLPRGTPIPCSLQSDDLFARRMPLQGLMLDREWRERLRAAGKAAVHGRFHAARMAEETAAVYGRYL